MPKKIIPQTPLRSVRADTSIGDCVRLMRDHGIGALVITSANAREELVGIFTERDLVRNIELIHKGNFWDNPVRSLMTTTLRTIDVGQLAEAPKIMVRYNIRHLPVTAEEKGRKRVVGVISMRDLFRMAMEKLHFDLERIVIEEGQKKAPEKKLVGVFSSDRSFRELVDSGARLTEHLLVKAVKLKDDFDSLARYFTKFEAIVVDVDDMSDVAISKFLAFAGTASATPDLYVVFSPLKLKAAQSEGLHKLSDRKRIHLLAKPVSVGLFYERFLREL